MNSIIPTFSITNRHLALIPVALITTNLLITSDVSKWVLASSYGFLTMLCGTIYCNDSKN